MDTICSVVPWQQARVATLNSVISCKTAKVATTSSLVPCQTTRVPQSAHIRIKMISSECVKVLLISCMFSAAVLSRSGNIKKMWVLKIWLQDKNSLGRKYRNLEVNYFQRGSCVYIGSHSSISKEESFYVLLIMFK